MNRDEFVAAVATKLEMPRKPAADAVAAVCAVIAEAAIAGEEIKLVGFGTYVVTMRGPSTGRNPRTGEPVDIGARRMLRFRPGKPLRDALQNGRADAHERV